MERWQKPEAENAHGGTIDHPSRSSLDYNTPLRSTRGDATTAPSAFYKLSSELSRESLRIPGAVPFMWEQSPGRRKFMAPSAISPRSIFMQPQAPDSVSTTAADPAKPNLATLFQQPSLKGVVAGMPAASDSSPPAPISSAILQISPPPAADHLRSSSARYSVMAQCNMPPGPFLNNAALSGNGDYDDAVSEEGISDVFTATAGEGLSVDDSLVLSGALRPASTPSEARDFIMHRFLPAAHTIAFESPHTPSRRFLPPVAVAAAPASPATTARSNGSFRDHAAACAAATRPSPLRYVSASSTPASNAMHLQPRGQLRTGSFHEEEEEEEEEEDEEEEPPFTPKACGIFPFHINLSFHTRHAARARPSSKHQHNKRQQQKKKKNSKLMNCAGTTTRIIDILRDDHSSNHDDESPVHRLRSRHSEAERERTKTAVLDRAGLLYTSSDPRIKPPFDSYYRGRPNLHQLFAAQQGASELNYNEEASEYNSFQDAPRRFQSPSPAALHLTGRAARAAYNMQSPSAAQRSNSFAGILSTTEQHLLNSSFYYYNMHSSINKPHYQPQLASPLLSSHVSGYHDTNHINPLEKANYHGITTNDEQWDAPSPSNHSAQKTHIIDNALYEPEDQDTNIIAPANCPSMFTTISEHVAKYSPNCTSLNQGTPLKQAGHGRGHAGYGERASINGDHYVSEGEHNAIIGDQHYVSRGDQCVSKEDYNVSKGYYSVSNGDHHMRICDYHHRSGNHYVINGDLHGCKGDHHVSNGSEQGDHYVSNNYRYASKDDAHYVINGDNHVSNGNNHVSNGDMYVSNGDLHTRINSSFLRKSLLSPPLPKSPTHSWLDRAMPLVASTNKSVGASSRFSHMHKAATPAEDYGAPVSTSKMRKQAPPSSAESPKWEALVKGSHLQPGHLRFSEELYHQSQNDMKVGAS